MLKKISDNTYWLKLSRHLRTSDVFNAMHLIPYVDSSSNKASNLRESVSYPGEDDVAIFATYYLEKLGWANHDRNQHN